MNFKCAYTELVPIDHLQPNPKNPNKHPEKQIKMLAKIIDYQGQRAPIVVSKRSGFITKGHCRLAAIKTLKWDKVAVDFQDYESEAQEYADIVADNKIAELAEHDDTLMLDEIKSLDLMDSDLELLGLDDLSFLKLDEGLDEKEERSSDEKFIIEVTFPNQMEMRDVHDDLSSQGYMVRIKSGDSNIHG